MRLKGKSEEKGQNNCRMLDVLHYLSSESLATRLWCILVPELKLIEPIRRRERVIKLVCGRNKECLLWGRTKSLFIHVLLLLLLSRVWLAALNYGSMLILFTAWWFGNYLASNALRRGIRAYLCQHGQPMCLECGYNLRGLVTPRCPECGISYDPGRIRLHR